MNKNERSPTSAEQGTQRACEKTLRPLSKIMIALLDEYSTAGEDKGYDPYNANSAIRAIGVRQLRRNRR